MDIKINARASSVQLMSVQKSDKVTSNHQYPPGQLVRLPESIISNDMLFKRMNEGGCTLYIAPPALKNPYCRQCNSSFNSAQQMDQHFQLVSQLSIINRIINWK